MRGTRAALVVSLVVTAFAPSAQASDPPAARAVRAPAPPNVVLIVTDDQRADTLRFMPTVRKQIKAKGVSFDHAFVVNPQCCPSRTSILTGLHSNHTGVYSNDPELGIQAFDDTSTLATWLSGVGYETSLIGKYLNWYRTTTIPPGWTDWHGLQTGGGNGAYYGYEVNDNGIIQSYGREKQDYSGEVFLDSAQAFIEEASGPFFLYLAPSAPHGPAIPMPRDEDRFTDLKPWRPEAYDEEDVSDKPAWLQGLPRLSRKRVAVIDDFRLRQLRTIRSLDREVEDLLSTLKSEGVLHDTMIIVTSDNGMSWGEHRWKGKLTPYDESIHVPLLIRFDALTEGGWTSQQLVSNIDIAPTIAELAGASHPGTDGISLVPALSDPAAPALRRSLLIEHHEERLPSYCALRTVDSLYVIYGTGEEEFYDLDADPAQVENQAGSSGAAASVTGARTEVALRCDPPPPGMVLPLWPP